MADEGPGARRAEAPSALRRASARPAFTPRGGRRRTGRAAFHFLGCGVKAMHGSTLAIGALLFSLGCSKMHFEAPPGAGDQPRRCLPVVDAPSLSPTKAKQRAHWTVELVSSAGAPNGTVVIDWSHLDRGDQPPVVSEVCYEARAMAPDVAVELSASWLDLPDHGLLALRLKVLGPRALHGTQTPSREGAYAFPFDVIRRDVRVDRGAARFIADASRDLEDFAFERGGGGMVQLTNRASALHMDAK